MFKKLIKKKETKKETEELVITHAPALVAVLLKAETDKGKPLTESEVIKIRDSASCIVMPIAVKLKVEESRGYQDIKPENVWVEWQEVRQELIEN